MEIENGLLEGCKLGVVAVGGQGNRLFQASLLVESVRQVLVLLLEFLVAALGLGQPLAQRRVLVGLAHHVRLQAPDLVALLVQLALQPRQPHRHRRLLQRDKVAIVTLPEG